MKAILCLDLGNDTGFACCDGVTIVSGTENFNHGRSDGGGLRYLKFRTWLKETFSMMAQAGTPISYVGFEEVKQRHKSTNTGYVYGGFLGTLMSFCEEMKTPYEGIGVGTIKKHITGNGHAGKPDVIKAVELKMNRQPKDDNEADALAILHYARSKNLAL